jgi:hypothetical protein
VDAGLSGTEYGYRDDRESSSNEQYTPKDTGEFILTIEKSGAAMLSQDAELAQRLAVRCDLQALAAGSM